MTHTTYNRKHCTMVTCILQSVNKVSKMDTWNNLTVSIWFCIWSLSNTSLNLADVSSQVNDDIIIIIIEPTDKLCKNASCMLDMNTYENGLTQAHNWDTWYKDTCSLIYLICHDIDISIQHLNIKLIAISYLTEYYAKWKKNCNKDH